MAGNPLVSLDGDRLSVAPGAKFVFGGDVIDRGPNARRLMRAFIDLKTRQPDQVVLLAGNRDINKLRLWRELQGSFFYPVPDTVRSAKDSASVLRWIFANTMGARQGFDFRKAELEVSGTDASDAAVPASFLEDVRPGGLLAEYLRCCVLAHRDGPNLFVHGGVTAESLGVVPGTDKVLGVDAWIDALNAWYVSRIARYFDFAEKDPTHEGWNDLIAYQAPNNIVTRRNQGSVVYGRTADDLNNPHLPDAETMRRLTDVGIHRLVVGHTPNGDAPSILRASDFELVCADNSYSPLEYGTRLLLSGDNIDVRAKAKVASGETVDLHFTLGPADSLIGKRDAESGLLVKGTTGDGRYLLQAYRPHFHLEQVVETEAAVRQRKLT